LPWRDPSPDLLTFYLALRTPAPLPWPTPAHKLITPTWLHPFPFTQNTLRLKVSTTLQVPSKMDFVPTSQPFEDGEHLFPVEPLGLSPSPSESSTGDDDSDFDFVGTSQPFDDGEEDLRIHYGLMTPLPPNAPCAQSPDFRELCASVDNQPDTDTLASDIPARRARLIRRAPPALPGKPSVLTSPFPRSFNLVHRVTRGPNKLAAELERKQQQARDKARRISNKIRALATATAGLRRKHRLLCAFAASGKNKENTLR
ncbi:hypothetical protein DFH09DRAFT_1398002, partial [Mycena vulgaris]